MILRLLLILGLSVAVVSCGIKDDLITPARKDTPSGEKDPSKPTHTIGR